MGCEGVSWTYDEADLHVRFEPDVQDAGRDAPYCAVEVLHEEAGTEDPATRGSSA